MLFYHPQNKKMPRTQNRVRGMLQSSAFQSVQPLPCYSPFEAMDVEWLCAEKPLQKTDFDFPAREQTAVVLRYVSHRFVRVFTRQIFDYWTGAFKTNALIHHIMFHSLFLCRWIGEELVVISFIKIVIFFMFISNLALPLIGG